MKAVEHVFVTDHALVRFKLHTGNQEATDADVLACLEAAKQVTKKSVEWYAPLVRNTVVPGMAYYFNEGSNMVLICEHEGGVLRVTTVYPLPAVVCSNMGSHKMAAIARSAKLHGIRDRRKLNKLHKYDERRRAYA